MVVVLMRQQPRRAALVLAGTVVALALLVTARATGPAHATSGASPYDVPQVVDTNPAPNIVETTLVADEASVDVGNGVTANVQAFNGSIPAPEFRLNVGDTVIVHFKNELSEVTGIHWHGIELANASDGTPLTQNQVEPGDTFLYKFTVTRPGIFWYHPHHHASTNQVFKGLYGPIIVTDPNEAELQASGAIPSAAQTRTLALSDITVCKAPGSNDEKTFDPSQPHVSGGDTPEMQGLTPLKLCETNVLDDEGNVIPGPLAEGDVPNIQIGGHSGPVAEGQTVLTNGKNVGGRAGDPSAPGALDAGASTLDVRPGQGLRLQIGNTATTRFFRLRLTDDDGAQIPLIRIGGQSGLLDSAVEEGGAFGDCGTDGPDYCPGEILLDPGDRVDVVAAIPDTATGTLTMWTEDFKRQGTGGFVGLPTVPVMHLNVTGAAVSPAYTIAAGTQLRAATGDPVPVLGATTETLLEPTDFEPDKTGLTPTTPDIQLTNKASTLGVNDIQGAHDNTGDYAVEPHMGSTRYAELGDTLELTVTNTTDAHHPFHLHGFSIQPIDLTKTGSPTFTYPHEFMDNVDVPAKYTLRFRIKLEDRPLLDGVTLGGGYGRWVFHCHIFFHATFGMISEFDVVAHDGNEKPTVDADDASVLAVAGANATMHGKYHDTDGDDVTLSASVGTVTDHGDGTYDWSFPTTTSTPRQLVYITATEDDLGKKGQAAFQLDIGYAFGGFFEPIPQSKYNAGATIPVRFTLRDANGERLADSLAQALAADCKVQIFFTGGDPSPNCMSYAAHQFKFNLKTSKSLAAGTYTIEIKVFVSGVVVAQGATQVVITS
jgi:FtsP/CotA-like multicopper oxidase with cupredoxin domain